MDQEPRGRFPSIKGWIWTTVLAVGWFLAHYVGPTVWPIVHKVVVEISAKGLVATIDEWRRQPSVSQFPTGSIEPRDEGDQDKLRKTEVYARCLELREKERKQSVARIEIAREEHTRCKAAFRPTFLSTETAETHCRPHGNIVTALEVDLRQAKPRYCRKPY